jgi:DNA topoisomerase-1
MEKSLIVVESPTKAKTLSKYLGKDFFVAASLGHVKDLPQKTLGVNVQNDFLPKFEILKGKWKIIKELREIAKKTNAVYLASDPDREGEAIAWHIAEELSRANKNIYRVLFHEITKDVVSDAIKNPTVLDKKKYESQLARRILDRLVGYEISPLLWTKIKTGLSAGRVQSVAVRLIVDRAREIEAFKPREYWVIDAVLQKSADKESPLFSARLKNMNGIKLEIPSQDEAVLHENNLRNCTFTVKSFEHRDRKRYAPPPYITSTLQQDGSRFLKMPAKKTMQIAQKLYEGIELGEEGSVGLITYMRTDSVRVADRALSEARDYIGNIFGSDYVPDKPNYFKNKKSAQDAHEAIRPTYIHHNPESVKNFLAPDEYKLYSLIFNRFIASQMSPAIYDDIKVEIDAPPYELTGESSRCKFRGFLRAYHDDDDEGNHVIPELSPSESLILNDIKKEQKFTQPPPFYTESSLIKELEERGIGRPSTYATIVSTIQEKKYVIKESGKFKPTELGLIVTDMLVAHFSEIVDYNFTAQMEENLDRIEEGDTTRLDVLSGFYKGFRADLDKARIEMKDMRRSSIPTEIKCGKCGKPMAIRIIGNETVLACSGYPACSNIKEYRRDENGAIIPIEEEVPDEKCPQCGSDLVIRRGRFGKFLACSGYPKCRFTKNVTMKVKCPMPDCPGSMVERRSKKGRLFFGCSNYPLCRFATPHRPVQQTCEKCGAPTMFELKSKNQTKMICLREKKQTAPAESSGS